ncbi:MAG: hypothetical protein R3A78_11805 [Polyangiales bacterium]
MLFELIPGLIALGTGMGVLAILGLFEQYADRLVRTRTQRVIERL